MTEEQPKCPVDHSARDVWANKLGKTDDKSSTQAGVCPVDHKSKEVPQEPSGCPVDHNSRSAWLDKVSVAAVTPDAIEQKEAGCDSSKIDNNVNVPITNVDLPVEREISSIPRTSHETNWIYPSQKQFFEAMKRKSWNPEKQDMEVVVPIHNAVNERVWQQIMNWERSNYEQAVKECGGISLTSFKGDLKALTPRAWFRSTFLGYQKPFDRHDWVVDRCGTQVAYVIDFYSGKADSPGASFFLDVRPKLNHWEGIKLRLARSLGWA